MTAAELLALLRLTMQEPRRAMRLVLGWRLTTGERLAFLVLLAILNVLSAETFAALLPAAPDQAVAEVLSRPFVFAGMQLLGLLVLAGLIHGIGRMFGGTGDGAGAQMAVAWLQVVFMVFQVAQIVAVLILPPQLTLVIGVASLVVALYLLPNFIAELHGFRSAVTTFVGMVFAAVLVTFTLSLFLALFLASGG